MAKFNFEKNLEHQSQAVKSTVDVFNGLDVIKPAESEKQFINPLIDKSTNGYPENIYKIREFNMIKDGDIKRNSNIIDIMMETGTGKTYTYTKTIFEINKLHGIFKFIIIVPTLSIKAGTIDFLKSDSCKEHFKEQYGKIINLHIVESQKNNKNKKIYIPSAINNFVNAGNFDKNIIQVMIINAGMINSETMQKSFDKNLFDEYSIPFDAISAIKPIVIIDEPHKFAKENKTWENIIKLNPQFILRYGATFPDKETEQINSISGKKEKIKTKDYYNLVYKLTAVDSFNKNLVKGVIGHITQFENETNINIEFINCDGNEATFKLTQNNSNKTIKLKKKESLEIIHKDMSDLFIENLNKTTVILSNGLELKKGDKINPFCYAQTLQEIMIEKAVKKHFELEKNFLKREVKIKPLTLFFIDNIEAYRKPDGYIRKTVEKYIKAEVTELLKEEKEGFYKEYLEKTLLDISKTHGGYFSQDNSEKDEAIEQELIEILHDKQAILDLKNPRRFIFSKWTLREGWDNPNVFQICKLRSSGSEISKLQEVGRGLRLPVNEYGNRVKDEQFYLNYFVDFTENDFVENLVKEINEKSNAILWENIPEKLDENMIKKIIEKYNIKDEDVFIEELVDKKVIKISHKFLDNGFDYIKNNYPLIFEGVGKNKIRKETDTPKKITIRTEKYKELKELWEKINQKVLFEYKIKDENKFKNLFMDFLQNNAEIMIPQGLKNTEKKVKFNNDKAEIYEQISIRNNELTTISTMNYDDFLKQLSKALNINIKTIHQSFIDTKTDINKYLNISTIRIIKQKFDNYLMYNAIDKFEIEYKQITSSIHPTKLTTKDGILKENINASDIGTFYCDENPADNYFYNELFYDSILEKENIKTQITEVIVFTKIPKNSVKIPVAGGKSYSPDFAYVINFDNENKKLYFIVETKNSDKERLSIEELQKIKHAEKFFGDTVKIKFKTQFSKDKITELIKEITDGSKKNH